MKHKSYVIKLLPSSNVNFVHTIRQFNTDYTRFRRKIYASLDDALLHLLHLFGYFNLDHQFIVYYHEHASDMLNLNLTYEVYEDNHLLSKSKIYTIGEAFRNILGITIDLQLPEYNEPNTITGLLANYSNTVATPIQLRDINLPKRITDIAQSIVEDELDLSEDKPKYLALFRPFSANVLDIGNCDYGLYSRSFISNQTHRIPLFLYSVGDHVTAKYHEEYIDRLQNRLKFIHSLGSNLRYLLKDDRLGYDIFGTMDQGIIFLSCD